MAIANYFYNQTTRKYVALFGTYFNQLKIVRFDNTNTVIQSMIVPISYAPFQKILAAATQRVDGKEDVAIKLPRMSFEITGYTFDAERKISPTRKIRKTVGDPDTGSRNFHYSGAPYDINFSLYIMAKYNEDAIQLMEQIVPFFNPDLTQTATIVPGIDPIDVPLILNGVTAEEIYEGDFTERRAITYTLDFTMKAWYFGPEREKKVIKLVDVNYATDIPIDTEFEEQQSLQPGLTDEGNSTTDIEESIDYQSINFDDDYGIINKIGYADEMILTVDQSLMTANTATIDIVQSGFAGRPFVVNWGDGTNEPTVVAGQTQSTTLTHEYTAAGLYDIKISFAGAHFKLDSSVVDVSYWGERTSFSSAEEMFKDNENLVTFTAIDTPNFLPGSSTSSMFENCINFTGEESALATWDLSNVIDTSDMFKNTG